MAAMIATEINPADVMMAATVEPISNALLESKPKEPNIHSDIFNTAEPKVRMIGVKTKSATAPIKACFPQVL